MKLIVAGGYVAATLAAVALFNADAENNWLALAIWAAASLVLGWANRDARFALLPLLAVPIAIPFGYADQWLGSDAPYVWWFAVIGGGVQVALVLAAFAARVPYERGRPSRGGGSTSRRSGPHVVDVDRLDRGIRGE